MNPNPPPVYAGPDADRIGFCDICGLPIYLGERHYRLPDGTLLCDQYECLEEWRDDYVERN